MNDKILYFKIFLKKSHFKAFFNKFLYFLTSIPLIFSLICSQNKTFLKKCSQNKTSNPSVFQKFFIEAEICQKCLLFY